MDLMEFLEENWFQITLLISIITFTIKLMNKINDNINDNNERFNNLRNDIKEFKDETNDKIDKINQKMSDDEKKRVDGQERNRLIMEGVEATLISLKNDGHNGPVTASLQAINEYKLNKASK